MKFFILVNPLDDAPKLKDPLATNKAAKAFIEEMLASGQFECAYQFVTGGGIAIANIDSAEEMWQKLVEYPLYSQFDWEVEPLVDLNFVFEKAIARMEKTG